MSDDDTYDLSRRKILGGIMTVGAAGATAGAGTMALFSDTEQSTGNTIQAGTLDLTADGNNGEGTTTVSIESMAPGETKSGTTTLNNRGSLGGFLNFDIGPVTNNENTVWEPEQGAPGEDGTDSTTGELARTHTDGSNALDVTAGFDTTGDGNIDKVVLDSAGKDPRNNIQGTTGIEYNPNRSLNSDSSVDFVVECSLPREAGNAVQSDGATFDLTFELLQQAAGSSVAITGNSPLSNYNWNPISSEAHIGDGSWYTGTATAKRNIYFAGEFSSFHDLPDFTVDDIQDISYWVKSSALNSANIYLTIYTKPENDGGDADAGWYDSRLQALPTDATDSSSFQDGQWNEFGTSSSAQHQLTFYDHVSAFPKPSPGNQPTLSGLQNDDFDWDSTDSDDTDDYAPQSYHDEEVLALSLQTGSTNSDIDAYLDRNGDAD